MRYSRYTRSELIEQIRDISNERGITKLKKDELISLLKKLKRKRSAKKRRRSPVKSDTPLGMLIDKYMDEKKTVTSKDKKLGRKLIPLMTISDDDLRYYLNRERDIRIGYGTNKKRLLEEFTRRGSPKSKNMTRKELLREIRGNNPILKYELMSKEQIVREAKRLGISTKYHSRITKGEMLRRFRTYTDAIAKYPDLEGKSIQQLKKIAKKEGARVRVEKITPLTLAITCKRTSLKRRRILEL